MGKIRDEILKNFQSAMDESEAKSYLSATKNLSDFYSQGTPKVYQRTGMLGLSGRTTGVQGGGEHLNFEIYADMGYNYDTGSFYTPKVFNEAEVGGSGILGQSGFWEKTIEETEEAIQQAFGSKFG